MPPITLDMRCCEAASSFCAASLIAAATRSSAEDSRPADRAATVSLKVGEFVRICETGKVICPASASICVDPSLVSIRDQGKGLELVGLKPGKTLCSVMSANQARQVFAVTVER